MSKVFPNLTRGKGLQDEYLKKAAKCVNWHQYTKQITDLELFFYCEKLEYDNILQV